MAGWSEFLNNNSLSAFLGAFSAFMLVVLNDLRRDRRTIRTINNELEINREHAKSKREALMSNRVALTEHNKVIPAPIMRFSADVIRQLTPGVLHRFSPDQRRALDAVCYTMEATDELLAETLGLSEKFRGELKDAERSVAADQLLSYYNDGIANLGRLIEMCDLYLAKEYRKIVTKTYHREDYAM